MTLSLIATCVAAFAYQLTLSDSAATAFLNEYALVPARFTSSNWQQSNGGAGLAATTLITSIFLHGGVLHLVFNMWTLWVFGPALEDRLGSLRFALLYFAAGLAAGMLHVVFNFSSAVPTIGASGAIAGVIAAYARRFPYAWVNVLQPIVIVPVFFMMPALAFAGIWFVTQVVQATGSLAMPSQTGGIAWWAHIGGFVAGWMIMGRTAKERDAYVEAHSATRSALWPWEMWGRMMRWWFRR